MTDSSRIRLARELLHCAKMVLDESRHREATKKIIARDASEIVRGAVFHYCKDLKQSAKKRGIQMNDFVIHHYLDDNYKEYIGAKAPKVKTEEDAQLVRHALMINSRKHRDTKEVNDYLKNQMSVPKTKRITRDTLKQLNVKLLDEISKCVLVPKGFHDWMHHNVNIENGKYTYKNDEKYVRDRDDFYDFYQEYSRNESYIDEITKYKCVDDTMKNAVNSLKILISVSTGEENFADEIEQIHNVFVTSKAKIIQQNRKLRD